MVASRTSPEAVAGGTRERILARLDDEQQREGHARREQRAQDEFDAEGGAPTVPADAELVDGEQIKALAAARGRCLPAVAAHGSSGQDGQTFEFFLEGHLIRGLWIKGKPWFVAKDVCDALGLVNARDGPRYARPWCARCSGGSGDATQ